MVEYHQWGGPGEYGPAIPAMVERVRKWIDKGHEVIIHTSRVSVEHKFENVEIEIDSIYRVLDSVGLPRLKITANKFIRITEFWDDRAVRVERNKGRIDNDFPKSGLST